MEWFDETEETFTKLWLNFCDNVAATGSTGKTVSDKFLRRLVIGAPVVLGFALLCSVVFLLQQAVPSLDRTLGIHDSWHFARFPTQYTSLVTHIFAHSDFHHLKGNLTHLLLIGPSVEHAFGSRNLITIILVVALASAAAHIIVGGNNTHQLGASGVVFACIILNSLVSANYGKIPLSFIIVAFLYLGDELVDLFFARDATSHHAHLVGGIVGGAAGFYIHKRKNQEKMRGYIDRLRTFRNRAVKTK